MKQTAKNESEVLNLMAKIQEQLNALDKKVDSLIARPQPTPAHTPKPVFQKPIHTQIQPNQMHVDQHKSREMHKIICADCKKESSIPFKPTGDRPVYCKECFSLRKTWVPYKKENDNKPQELPPAQPNNVVTSVTVKEKKKPASVKKTVSKKKPVLKKKKK